jgi:CheY-like chemotaxis protein
VEVTISDTGEGITPEFLPHVFDRFRQADATTTRKHGGLGLGLAIVKQLVELHGGQVRVKSAGKGQGTTFSVSLPIAVTKEEERGREHPKSEAGRGMPEVSGISLEGLRVLVVEDEPDARELIRRLLTEHRAVVRTAGSADEGMSMMMAETPEVIISDIGMPGKDGYQFLREVRKLPAARGGKTPAIALTAFARSEDRTRAMLAGYQVHLSKPIDGHELVATVAGVTGRT